MSFIALNVDTNFRLLLYKQRLWSPEKYRAVFNFIIDRFELQAIAESFFGILATTKTTYWMVYQTAVADFGIELAPLESDAAETIDATY